MVDPSLTSGRARVSLGEIVLLTLHVEVTNVETVDLSVAFNSLHLTLIQGAESKTVVTGLFGRTESSWGFRADRVTNGKPTKIRIDADAGHGLHQSVLVPVEIER